MFHNRSPKPEKFVAQTRENQSIHRSAAHPQLPYPSHPSPFLGPNGSGAFYHPPNTPSSLNSAHPTTPSSASFLVSASDGQTSLTQRDNYYDGTTQTPIPAATYAWTGGNPGGGSNDNYAQGLYRQNGPAPAIAQMMNQMTDIASPRGPRYPELY